MTANAELIRTDIDAYLERYQQQDMLRFITCGSVDDGKSTLIGRLLHDSGQIFEDHMQAIRRDSARVGTTGDEVDLALLVDGLQSEREQGITIDVAYRYFATEERKFIIADTPGHEQYTRNMATGASTANLALILIDARKGVLEQTRRHSYIVDLLGIRHAIVVINKMDLMDYDQAVYERIRQSYLDEVAAHLSFADLRFVPVSALKGDNVVSPSERMPWYEGETLMRILETVDIAHDRPERGFRMPVQYVNRPNPDFRGYCGTVVAGGVRPGDPLVVLPSGVRTHVASIVTADGELAEATADMAITLTVTDEIDISRGDVLVAPDDPPAMANELNVMLVWMDSRPMRPGIRYGFKSGTRTISGEFSRIEHLVDINQFSTYQADEAPLNGIACCTLHLDEPLVFEPYRQVPDLGSFIVIDRIGNGTVGAGMIRAGVTVSSVSVSSPGNRQQFSDFERELNALIRKHFPHWGARDITLSDLLGDRSKEG